MNLIYYFYKADMGCPEYNMVNQQRRCTYEKLF